jgi:anti-sigma factor RsiW
MTCREFRKLLTPWLDGELAPEKAQELKSWLDGCETVRQCSQCRKLFQEHRSFHRLFNSLPTNGFPAHLHHRIMDEIQRREPVYRKKAVRVRWQTVTATIVVVLSLYAGSLVGISTFRNRQQSSIPSSELYTFGENSMITDFFVQGVSE